jgi:endoglucanase
VKAAGSTPTGACKVVYKANDWGTGFTANVDLTNTGATPVSGWTLAFAWPGNQRITGGWSAAWTQTGNQVTATNLSWNATLQPGATANLGFQATYTGANPPPTAFTLNGATCTTG